MCRRKIWINFATAYDVAWWTFALVEQCGTSSAAATPLGSIHLVVALRYEPLAEEVLCTFVLREREPSAGEVNRLPDDLPVPAMPADPTRHEQVVRRMWIAPRQCTALGVGTSGCPEIDAYLSSRHVEPENQVVPRTPSTRKTPKRSKGTWAASHWSALV